MVDLKAIPYCLSDEDIKWVEDTIKNMSDEEKVGQLFFDNQGTATDEQLKEWVDKYHIGGFRYNGIPCKRVHEAVDVLQSYSPIPLFIACNTESGGNGTGTDGDYIGDGIKIAATGNPEYAYDLGYLANKEGATMGNNMAFAPIVDIHYNWENTEIVKRAFGNDVDRIIEMSNAYMRGVHDVPRYACVAKHFPGNGQDFRDAHLSNNINNFNEQEWMETYGKIYKSMIDNGLDGIMGGHIMMPNYMREVQPGIKDDDMLPATLEPAIMTGLLRDKLGFNGMVVTDASHMVGMTNRLPHDEMVVAAINAGCDMYLFFNDPDEDFQIMFDAYKSGKISEERMNEALTRILGLKAKMGLNKVPGKELVPPIDELNKILHDKEFSDVASAISEDAITLVKYKDKDVLPITKEKYKKIMIVLIKGYESFMGQLMAMQFGGKGKQTPAEVLCEKLKERGFDAFVYENPADKLKRLQAEGKEVNMMDIYHAGKSAIKDFKEQQDLVITVFDVDTGRPSFGMAKGGGEIPWYVHDVPVIGVSVNSPTMLADVPTLRTYINAYDSRPFTMDALVDKLLTGPEAFVGKDPIDSFCGMWDTYL